MKFEDFRKQFCASTKLGFYVKKRDNFHSIFQNNILSYQTGRAVEAGRAWQALALVGRISEASGRALHARSLQSVPDARVGYVEGLVPDVAVEGLGRAGGTVVRVLALFGRRRSVHAEVTCVFVFSSGFIRTKPSIKFLHWF